MPKVGGNYRELGVSAKLFPMNGMFSGISGCFVGLSGLGVLRA